MTRRELLGLGAGAAACAALPKMARAQERPDSTLTIGACMLDASPKHLIKTVGYNGTIPGPLLRLREGRRALIEVVNNTREPEIVHWHGLKIPSAMDGAMEEGSPMIQPGQRLVYEYTPRPAGFRWYHTHTTAGGDLRKAQYTGQHGFLYVEPANDAGAYDREEFLALHDWRGELVANADGAMNPAYEVTTINGKMLGHGEPIRVKQGERLLLHVLNSSATEVHWIALAGHEFQVIALDGNPVPKPAVVPMLRLAPAERVCAIVEMKNPGVWVMGEVRKHVQAAGMGVVVEYAGATGAAKWEQPMELVWNYEQFGNNAGEPEERGDVEEIPLVIESRFMGHGAMERWMINGKSYPDVPEPVLTEGRRYRLRMQNKSMDDHPMHMHRHTFELKQLPGAKSGAAAIQTRGIMKDTVLARAGAETVVEVVADDPGKTLFHCHQQNHMDLGFMMLFRYA
ncbi:MAG TPA: multicopper oxidase family protein [Acidobacteriaceae bacterium]|nr:multicopper oxidase family protein [Acidobacteriaceae bacterium]